MPSRTERAQASGPVSSRAERMRCVRPRVILSGASRRRAESKDPARGERRHAAATRNPWLRAAPRQRENGIPFAGMTTAARSSQRTQYHSQTALPRPLSIPANQIPFSFGSAGVRPHPSKRNTVLARRRPGPDCASGDNEGLFFASSCRRRHSCLVVGLSPAAQFGPAAVAGGALGS